LCITLLLLLLVLLLLQLAALADLLQKMLALDPHKLPSPLDSFMLTVVHPIAAASPGAATVAVSCAGRSAAEDAGA
jgi:hypothetical protein